MSNKLAITTRVQEIFDGGGNILEFLKSQGDQSDRLSDILISYDFQAGSYTAGFEKDPSYWMSYTDELARLIGSLGDVNSILEVGCGEATTLATLASKIPSETVMGGFDISWSRVRFAREFAARQEQELTLFCGDLFNIPLADNSVDIVYSSHSLEPNGGREAEAIAELARVARRYLILLEPAFDLGPLDARERMERHGYVKNLADEIQKQGLELVRHELFPVSANPLNPTGLYLVKMSNKESSDGDFKFQCPVTGQPLVKETDAYFSPEAMLAYPMLGEIPYLLESHAILATKYQAETKS